MTDISPEAVERLAKDCDLARKVMSDADNQFKTGQGIFEDAAATLRAQAARIIELETQVATARNDALDEAEAAMREECTAPDGTYDMKTEADIAQAEAATIEVASRAILALKTETPT